MAGTISPTPVQTFRGLSEQRRGEGLFLGPSPKQALLEGSVCEAEVRFPLANREGLAVERDAMIRSGVVGLSQRGGPTAVFGGIGSVDVYPVQAKSGRTGPHVGQERLETLVPAFAHRYASGAIVFVTSHPWVVAPSFGGAPSGVLAGSEASMLRHSGLGGSADGAPAALDATSQVFAQDGGFIAAVTAAYPSGTLSKARLAGSPPKHHEPANSESSHIGGLVHTFKSTTTSQAGS